MRILSPRCSGENALYDPAFVAFDPNSTTDMFDLSERDLTYSRYRPDLAALGAVDGMTLSGRAPDNDDPLSRRDRGLEFLDVTSRLDTTLIAERGPWDIYRIRNSSDSVVDTHLCVVVRNLAAAVELQNATGRTSGGEPFVRVFLDGGVLEPGQSIEVELRFASAVSGYDLVLLSGQGTP